MAWGDVATAWAERSISLNALYSSPSMQASANPDVALVRRNVEKLLCTLLLQGTLTAEQVIEIRALEHCELGKQADPSLDIVVSMVDAILVACPEIVKLERHLQDRQHPSR